MKVKKLAGGILVLEGNVLKGAEEAFQEGRYVEAFSLLQAVIDAFMIFVYQMREGEDFRKTDEVHHKLKYRFKMLRDYMNGSGLLSDEEMGKLDSFYDMRNRIVHGIVMYAYQSYERYRIRESEAIKGFDLGRELYKILDAKTTSVGLEMIKPKT